MPQLLPDPPSRPSRKVLIVDDHPVLRRGLATLLASEPDLVICGEAATCKDTLEAVCNYRPDLVTIDLDLPDGDGLQLIEELTALDPPVSVLVISTHDEALYAERCFQAGARGFVTKVQSEETIMFAIRRVIAGQNYMSDRFQARVAGTLRNGQAPAPDSSLQILSNRELQVFRLIGQGRSTRQIAEGLSLSIKTIESHRERIKHKLTISSATELVHRATQWRQASRAS